jgi:hypothetical protein
MLSATAAWSSSEWDATQSVAWGDVDSDGDLDLAAGNYNAQPNRLYRNDGGTLTTSAVWSSSESDDTGSVAWGDVDGDGDLDLAVGNDSQPNRLYRNDNGTLTASATWSSSESDNTNSVAWGDVDSDGDLDLVVGNAALQPNRLYRNDGGTLTASAVWSSSESDQTLSVAWGDVDGDGDLDLAVGNSGQPNRLYRNDAGMLTASAVWSSSEWDTTYSVAWGDFEGDGDLDLAVGNGGAAGQPDRLYRNDNGTLTSSVIWSSSESAWTRSVAWGDVDGDGDLDLAAGTWGAPNRLYRSNGVTLTAEAVWSFGESDNTYSVAWGDVDGDGDLDLAVGNYDQPNRLYRNDGGTLTADATWSSSESDATYSVVWGDVDGDGDLDLAVGNNNAQPNRLYRNNNGTLTADAAWSSSESDWTTSVAWGDVDGDGDLDLAVGNWFGYNRLYRNDHGTLTAGAVWSSSEVDNTQCVAWGDVDGDGDLDLVVGNQSAPIRLYRNADGVLTASAVWSSSEGDGTLSVAWGDVDGDGDLDLAVGKQDAPNRLYRNDNGTLTSSAVWSSIESAWTWSVAWGDVDGDGDLDLAVGNEGSASQPNRLYRNDGGTLIASAVWSSTESDATRSVAWGDVDGDGDLDLAVGNPGAPNRLYLNGRPANVLAPGLGADQIGLDPVLSPADGYASAHIWEDGIVPLTYTLAIPGGAAQNLCLEYSLDGGGQWFPAPAASGTMTENIPTLLGRGLWFDGVNAYVEAPHQASLQPITFTLEAWIRADAWAVAPVSGTILGKDAGSSGYALRAGDNGRLAFGMGCAGGWSEALSAPLMITNTWYHVAGTYDGLTMTVLINGVPAGTAACSNPLPSTQSLRIGDTPAAEGRRFAGAIDEVRLWAVVRTPAQLQAGMYRRFDGSTAGLEADWRFDEGAGAVAYDHTGHGHDGALVNGHWALGAPDRSPRRFTWDVYASGFFGQSDNVVLRLLAQPDLRPQPNQVPGPYQRPFVSAATFPIRVRGSQVRVMQGSAPVQGALVYRIPAGQLSGEPYLNLTGQLALTNPLGYLAGHGALAPGDQLVALLLIATTASYRLYHTSAAPTTDGLDTHLVTSTGVQTLTVSAANPLILFDLTVSLEWDARSDPVYLQTLQNNFQQASTMLYDWSNGQTALGQVTIYHDRQHWDEADVRIYATNRLGPNANQGGVVPAPVADPANPEIFYRPGQVRMGVTWSRTGEPGASLGDDWPLTLAHELGHYLLYLDDNYLGLDLNGQVVTVASCPSAMSDPYRQDTPYGEFHPEASWSAECANTLSNVTTGRSDWDTIAAFYPALAAYQNSINPGPASLPLAVTTISFVEPAYASAALADPIFYLTDEAGERYLPDPRTHAYLFQTVAGVDRLLDLGSPVLDQILARGAHLGDRLCAFETSAQRLGCEVLMPYADQLRLVSHPNWQPEIIITPVSSQTIIISVTAQVEPLLPLRARLFPLSEAPTTPISLSLAAGVYRGIFTTASPAPLGYVQVWVAEAERREAVSAYSAISGSPGPHGAGSGSGSNAPGISPDGQVILYSKLPLPEGSFYLLQESSLFPAPLPWATRLGPAYRLMASPDAPALEQASLSMTYLESEVAPGEEAWIRVYYWEGSRWRILSTTLDTYHNTASALVQGPGLYALMSSYQIRLYPGWNNVSYPVYGTRPVTESLASIAGYYGQVYYYDPTDGLDHWKLYDPSVPGWVNDLSALSFGRGYWISVTQNITTTAGITLYLKGTAAGGQVLLPAAFNAPPATFYGRLNAGPGQAVTAWVGNTACGQGLTRQVGGQAGYVVDVVSAFQAPGCGAPGRAVSFRVGQAPQPWLGSWTDARPLRLDFLDLVRLFIPLVLRW